MSKLSFVKLPPYGLLELRGLDTPRYLQGRITQDIQSPTPGSTSKSLLLTPQGKIQGQFFLKQQEERFLLISDPLESEEAESALIEALLMFKVADQVEVSSLSSRYHSYAVFGENIEDACRAPDRIILRGEFCDFLLVPKEFEQEFSQTLKDIATEKDFSFFEAQRIRKGIPRFGKDLSKKISGPELKDIESVVSFQKGCYAGQEVVEMAIARGKPNKTLVHLSSAGEFSQKEDNPKLFLPAENGSKECGFLTSSAYCKREKKTYALGFVKSTTLDSPEFFAGDVSFTKVT